MAHSLSALSSSELTPTPGWGGEMGPERDGHLPEVTQQAWSPGSYLCASLCLQSLPFKTSGDGEKREGEGPAARDPQPHLWTSVQLSLFPNQLRMEGARQKGIGTQWRTEKGKRRKGSEEKVRRTLE